MLAVIVLEVTVVRTALVSVVDKVVLVIGEVATLVDVDMTLVFPLTVVLVAAGVLDAMETVVVVGLGGGIILHGIAGTHKLRSLSASSNPLAINSRTRAGSPLIVIETVY